MVEYVNYSMGVCSAYIAARLAETCHAPVCVFSDTGAEDIDTYRFGWEVARRYGMEVVEASAGIDLWAWFRREKTIPARQIPACSIALKIKPARQFYASAAPGRVAYGYDRDEEERAERTLSRWQHTHLTPWFPLIEWGVSKQQCFGFFNDAGIKTPRVYEHFRHANCLPCKNFRLPDWQALRHHYPDRFAEAVTFEAETGLRWMQDGPLLADLPPLETGKRRRALPSIAPAFSFDAGCDACGVD